MAKQNLPVAGIYGITDTEHCDIATVVRISSQLLQAGLSLLQFRCKNLPATDKIALASRLQAECQKVNAPFIVNDDPELAVAVNADGVHLGKNDADIIATRRSYPELVIGVSCYGDVELAKQKQDEGADYVAFGAFYPSPSKPDAIPASIKTLQQAKQTLSIPIVAIGGITPDNGSVLIQSGADFLAVISGLYSASEPVAELKRYLSLY